TISNVLDISERKQAERAMHDRLRFEVLLSEMATAFVHVTPDDLDRVTGEWLQRLVEHMDVERATLWQSPRRGEPLRITHTWALGDLPVFPATFAASDFPWTMARLHEGTTVVRSRFDDLPPEAAAEV